MRRSIGILVLCSVVVAVAVVAAKPRTGRRVRRVVEAGGDVSGGQIVAGGYFLFYRPDHGSAVLF